MKTTIDNNQRVFLISRQGFSTRDFFCNLASIPAIIRTELEPHDDFIIFEYWNKKFKRCSKKHINEIFAANQINFKIK